MKERDRRTAEKFHILDNCQKLEAELLKIPGVGKVDFDLDGFYDDMGHVIFLTKYDIKGDGLGWFKQRREMVENILSVAAANGLPRTQDSIEDQGTWLYFVFKHNKEWRKI